MTSSNGYLLFLYKMLEKHLWNSFLLYLVVEIWNKLLYKRGFLKNFSKFSDKHKQQSSGCVQSKDVLKNFANFTGKNLCWSLFLIKLEFWGPATLLKKTPTQVFSCEIYKLFKNNYFEEHLSTSASKHYLKRDSNSGVFLRIL